MIDLCALNKMITKTTVLFNHILGYLSFKWNVYEDHVLYMQVVLLKMTTICRDILRGYIVVLEGIFIVSKALYDFLINLVMP